MPVTPWSSIVPAASLPAATTTAQGAVKLPAASVNYQPASPAATASLTLVMMGLGSTVVYTPSSTGKVLVVVTAYAFSNTALALIGIGARYGTGAAPANGAAVTGTRFGSAGYDPSVRAAVVNAQAAAHFTDLLALTPGTQYWFDLALSTNTAADTSQVEGISFTLAELVA